MSRIFRIWHRINSLYSWFHRNASWSSTISKPGRTLSWILWYGLCFWACWREPLAWYKSRPWRRIQAILQTGLTLITLYRPLVDIWTYEKILCTYVPTLQINIDSGIKWNLWSQCAYLALHWAPVVRLTTEQNVPAFWPSGRTQILIRRLKPVKYEWSCLSE